MTRIYDQGAFCGNCGNCPAVEEENGVRKLYDPAYPGQGSFTFTDNAKLRERFDAAVAGHSLTITDPDNADAGSYSFRNHEEMHVFSEQGFAALESA